MIIIYYVYRNVVIYQPKHLRNKFDPSERLYEGEFNVDDLKKFIKSKVLVLLLYINLNILLYNMINENIIINVK